MRRELAEMQQWAEAAKALSELRMVEVERYWSKCTEVGAGSSRYTTLAMTDVEAIQSSLHAAIDSRVSLAAASVKQVRQRELMEKLIAAFSATKVWLDAQVEELEADSAFGETLKQVEETEKRLDDDDEARLMVMGEGVERMQTLFEEAAEMEVGLGENTKQDLQVLGEELNRAIANRRGRYQAALLYQQQLAAVAVLEDRYGPTILWQNCGMVTISFALKCQIM